MILPEYERVMNFIYSFVNILTKNSLKHNRSRHYKIVNNYGAKC
jgi:hypothetical protein